MVSHTIANVCLEMLMEYACQLIQDPRHAGIYCPDIVTVMQAVWSGSGTFNRVRKTFSVVFLLLDRSCERPLLWLETSRARPPYP